jgi:hypothetical protein
MLQEIQSNATATVEPPSGSTAARRLPSARFWLENRSRMNAHRPSILWSWQVAGINDALMRDKPKEARARAAVLMGASDQMAIDRGSWFHAQQRSPQTTILDPRWIELAHARLTELDSMFERRKRLETGRPVVEPKPKGFIPEPKAKAPYPKSG